MRASDIEGIPEPGGFATTAWSVIRHAQSASSAKCRQALDQLLTVYWRPVYWSIRMQWSAEPEDARDLTQEYFSTFLEKGLIRKVDRGRGTFRSYVKETLKNFMLMRKRARRTVKRGGRIRIVSLENMAEVEREVRRTDEPVDRQFDRELMRSILAECMTALRQDCEAAGDGKSFEIFQAYYTEETNGGAPTYADLQARFGMSMHDVKNGLHALRSRFRERVLEHLRDGASSEEELMAEVKDLFER